MKSNDVRTVDMVAYNKPDQRVSNNKKQTKGNVCLKGYLKVFLD